MMMLRRALTQRGQAKRREKELKWSEIPEAAHPLFKEAEKVQWEEHLSYHALEAMSLEESERVRQVTDAARIPPCRWAYRDKNWAATKSHAAGEADEAEEPKWRCKSRLVSGGHRDPDLGVEALSTDAPTLSCPGFIMCMMQKLADGLLKEDKWEVAAAPSLREAISTWTSPSTFTSQRRGFQVCCRDNLFALRRLSSDWPRHPTSGRWTCKAAFCAPPSTTPARST